MGTVDALEQKVAEYKSDESGKAAVTGSVVETRLSLDSDLTESVSEDTLPEYESKGGSLVVKRSEERPKKEEVDAWELLSEDMRLYYYANGTTLDTATKLAGKARNMLDRKKLSSQPGYADRAVFIIRDQYYKTGELVTFRMVLWGWWKRYRYKIAFIVCAIGLLIIGGLILFLSPRSWYRLGLCTTAVGLLSMAICPGLFAYLSPSRITYGGRVSDSCHFIGEKNTTALIAALPQRTTVRRGKDVQCKQKWMNVGFTIAKSHLWVPRGCTHNMERALLTRQLLPPLSEHWLRSQLWLQAVESFIHRMTEDYRSDQWFHYEPLSYHEAHAQYVRHLSGKRLARYMTGVASLERGERISPDTSGFVKKEWLLGKKDEKLDPRFISSKDVEYYAATALGYYDFQKQLCSSIWNANDLEGIITKHFLYPGGLDPIQLGTVISHFETLGWHVYEGDFSRYDGHTEIEALDAEFDLYARAGMPRRLLELLREQRHTKGVCKSGNLSFTCTGKRASGVINTTMGNTLCGMVLLSFCMEGNDWFIIQMGDDNLLFSKQMLNVDRIVDICKNAGHKLELVHRGDDQEAYDATEFCSSLFWDVGESRVLGPKPFRVLAKAFMPTEMLTSTKLMGHIRGVANGFKHYSFIPVLGWVCER